MEIDKVQSLARIVREHGLTKLECTQGDTHILIEAAPPVFMQNAMPAIATLAASPVMDEAPAAATPAAEANLAAQKSPLVGTVYLAPSSDSPAFVSEGDRVKKGEVICIVESMKMLNDICADHDGIVARRCVENGDMVEYGQTLFMIQPE